MIFPSLASLSQDDNGETKLGNLSESRPGTAFGF